MDNILNVFGAHLKNIRLSKSLTQAELAFRGEFDRNYIGMLERGERNPSLVNLYRLSNALGISLSELVDF